MTAPAVEIKHQDAGDIAKMTKAAADKLDLQARSKEAGNVRYGETVCVNRATFVDFRAGVGKTTRGPGLRMLFVVNHDVVRQGTKAHFVLGKPDTFRFDRKA